MDTRTPPIPLKNPEKQQQQQHQKKKERDVSLPPLTPYPSNRANPRTANRTHEPTCSIRCQEQHQKRPYRVLQIGATPLMHACQQSDRPRVLRLLKEQEHTIGYRDRTLRNALHYCMDAGTGGAVAAAAPELVNSPDAEGHTPLHLAVIAGDTQLVAVLLANGADVNAKDIEGHSVLHWATVCGEAECVKLVLSAGARPSTPDMRGGSPLHYAAQCCGAAATAELAVPKKVGVQVLQTLLEFGADVNAKDEDGRQPILWAASAGSVEAVLALARAGGSAAAGASDKDGLTALHCAASRGHARCIEALVNLCGSQPDHVDDNGCSALHYAATLGHADATALILKLGADPNRQDRKGRTPALCAAAKGQLETLKILAQHGGSLNVRTVRGTGVAHEAVASGRTELVKWLVKKRPSTLDVATQDGKTPLHVAALHGYLDVCKVLLDNGARINTVLRTGKGNLMTPLDAALYRGHRDCAKLIQMHGGTTAQKLRTNKSAPNRAKLRLKRSESSTESEGTPRRRVGEPVSADLYYEEQWIEKRTRKRGSSRKMARRDSRSFSEEEVRLSKTSSKHDRDRRARSESARYEDDDADRKFKKKRNGRRSKGKHDYSESSSESSSRENLDEELEESAISRTTLHEKVKKRKKDSKEDKDEISNEEASEDETSVSDDSLEVVVVRRSVEKKCEKVVSGRKSKTPRESSRETRVTRTRRSSRKSSHTQKSRSSDLKEPIADADKRRTSKDDRLDSEDKARSRYRKDGTDSTSQEAVERVVVTAMVHKDQLPDTSKSDVETAASEVDSKMEALKTEAKSEMEDILEQADKLHSELVTKAADLKRDVEEMKQQASQSAPDDEKKKSSEDAKEDDRPKGRLDTIEASQSEKSGKTSPSKSEISSSSPYLATPDESAKKITETKNESTVGTRESVEKEDKSSKMDVEDTSVESKQTATSSPTAKSKSRSQTAKARKKKVSPERAKKDGKSKSVSPDKSSDEKREPEKISESLQESAKQESERKSSVDKEKSPVRNKSVDFSSESKDSAIPDDVGDASVATSRRKSVIEDDVKPDDSKRSVGVEDLGVDEDDKEMRYIDESSSGSPKSGKYGRGSRPSTGRGRRGSRPSSRSPTKRSLFESSGEQSPDRSAIVAVIESPEWDDEDDEEIDREIREAIGEDDAEIERSVNDELGIVRVLPSTSEEETPRRDGGSRGVLPDVQHSRSRVTRIQSPAEKRQNRLRVKQRRDSGSRDSGIEPSPRVSRIPRRRNDKCCPITEKQQALNMETITRDVQINMRRYHLERKIFFQLMELKRLQIRHGRANEHVLVKRQVEAFHKAGMAGPMLGVAKYDDALTFKDFEAFLYDQLRKLQRRSATPQFCTDAKHCTERTHRCHHTTSAYTSTPIYTYLGGSGQEERTDRLPKIESKGRGHMTVEVTHGEEKQVIALPVERLDRTKRYFVTFTVKGEDRESEKPKSSLGNRRNAKSI